MMSGNPPFQINLSSRYRWYHGMLRGGLYLLFGLLAVGMMWDLSNWLVWQRQARQLEPAVQRVVTLDAQFRAESEREGFLLTDEAMKNLPQAISFTNRLLVQRGFSWSTLLHELEGTVPPGLALKGIQNDFREAITIRLTGTAVSFEVVTAFILALANQDSFHEPRLAQHNEKKDGLVDFHLTVGYRGP